MIISASTIVIDIYAYIFFLIIFICICKNSPSLLFFKESLFYSSIKFSLPLSISFFPVSLLYRVI